MEHTRTQRPSHAVGQAEPDPELVAEARAELLRGHARMLRTHMPISVVATLIAGTVLWFYADRTQLTIGIAGFIIVAAFSFWLMSRLAPDAESDEIERCIVHAQLLGGFAWGLLFAGGLPMSGGAQLFMAMLIPATMAGNAMENTANAKTFLAFHIPFSVLATGSAWLTADQVPDTVAAAIGATAIYFTVLARARGLETQEHALLAVQNESLAARLHAVNEQLEYRSTHDTLTGLPNRLAIERGLNKLMANAEERPVAALFIDLDGFKDINDTMGHDIGDDLLVVVARRFAEVVPDEALLGRLGGDEMVVLFEDFRSLERARDLAQRLLDSLNPPIEIAGTRQRIGASIGLSVTSMSCRTGRDLLRFSDIALYEAKAAGGRCWVEFSPEMLDGAQRSNTEEPTDQCPPDAAALFPAEGDARTV